MSEQQSLEKCECQAGIQDVFHQDDVLAAQGLINIFGEADFPGGVPCGPLLWNGDRTTAITRDSDKLESGLKLDHSDQVG